MSDPAHIATDKKLNELERKLKKEYSIAAKEVKQKADDYFSAFAQKDAGWQQMVADKKVKKKDYINWRKNQMLTHKRWTTLQNELAENMVSANQIAHAMTFGYQPDIYALNVNFATYDVEHSGKLDTHFTLYDKDTVERLMRDDPDLLPPPGAKVKREIALNKDLAWNKQQVQSVMFQGIVQGESVDQIATRLAETVATRNYNSAVRYARTMTTNTQNAGRYEGYRRAAKLGVDLKIEWCATLDGRTRHEHRQLHGQRRDVDEPFEVDGIEILYPAQTGAGSSDIPQQMIWNCRCTLLAWVKGFEGDTVTSSPKMGDMSFEEWQNEKTKGENVAKVNKTNEQTLTVKSLEKQTQKTMKDNYEYHRKTNELRSVAANDLTDEFFEADYGKMSLDSAQAFDNTFNELSSRFDTPLCKVRMKTKDEVLMNPDAIASTIHDYNTDVCTITINPVKCNDYGKLIEKIKGMQTSGYAASVLPENYSKYVATHEFAHSIFDLTSELNNKKNWVNANYDIIKKARKEVQQIYGEYISAVEIAEKQKKDLDMKYILGDATVVEDAWRAVAALRSVKISKYSLTNADEFLAESFVAVELGATENKFAKRAHAVLVKYFGRK